MPRHKGGYAESTSSERRFPTCGYLASSLRKLRRARDAEQFGYVDGYRALRDQYRSLCAIRMSRTSGRACNSVFLRQNSSSAFFVKGLGSQFLQQEWPFRVAKRLTNLAVLAEMVLHEMDLKVI